MDLINQNKFKNWLIIVLLAINLITVSVIWIQIVNKNQTQQVIQNNRPSESVNLLKKELDLNEDQTKQLQKMRADQFDQSKKYNDRLNDLKKQLAEELFKDSPDTTLANSKAKEIGDLQSKVESIRFNHFKELLAICTPEQKEKLKPILIELFGRKPPKDELKPDKRPDGRENGKHLGNKNRIERNDDNAQIPREERPVPPSVDEKLAKYSQRLNFTKEQEQKVRAVLLISMQKSEELRSRKNPDRNEIESEKEKFHNEEDKSVMKILNEDQKKEFIKMISKRRKP
jgi:Spy/CpxP family protein refolding chaperone